MTNIDYKLAKELKEAGFPQKVNGDVYINGKFTKYPYSLGSKDELVAIPTSDEVIEELGDDFLSTEKHTGQIGATNHVNVWYAAKSTDMEEYNVGEIGKTPLEALIRLYIAVNKK